MTERQLMETDVSFQARLRRSLAWRSRSATAQWRALPDFVVIGGQRCGTTSLFDALGEHRQIAPSFRKEVHFLDIHYERGVGWYRANFPLRARLGGGVTGEATPNYLAFPQAPERLAGITPDVKLIALLRHPVERAHSAWKLRTYEGGEKRSFAQAVEDELAGVEQKWEGVDPARQERWRNAMRFIYLDKSRYAEHLSRWLEHFDRSRLLLLQSEKLFAAPEESLRTIQSFLGVDHDPAVQLPRINYTQPSKVDAGIRRELNEYFAPQIDPLPVLTGVEFDWD